MRLTFSKVEQAIRASDGIIAHAARSLGCSRVVLYKWLEKYPELELVREEAEAELGDEGENFVAQAIRNGDMKTIRWYLERRRKDRFSTRQEQTGADGAPLEVHNVTRTIVDPENDE